MVGNNMEYRNERFTGERALFASEDLTFFDCLFEDGESPLKESKRLKIFRSTFNWKYPLWYCNDVEVHDCKITYTGRSGIWYTKNITINNSLIEAPKTFRRSEKVTLNSVDMPHADETFWKCNGIRLNKVIANGDYFGFNSEDVEIDNLTLLGNYAFDGGKNIKIRNSTLTTKDAFWNSENVTLINCTIIGEYFGWNSKNITLVNCTVESHQGFCYMENLKMINCRLINTDLCFEYCSDLDIEVTTEIDSVKNPISGKIHAYKIKELILEDQFIDKSKTDIKVDVNE